jgi:hypothetical protein
MSHFFRPEFFVTARAAAREAARSGSNRPAPDVPTTSNALLQALFDTHNGATWRLFDARYRPILLRFARRLGLSTDDAADVAQDGRHSLRACQITAPPAVSERRRSPVAACGTLIRDDERLSGASEK